MNVEDWFWSHVDRGEPGECWRWQSSTSESGHGRFHFYAHRFALLLQGEDIEGSLVCHRCDNPWCVNPDHLYVGTCSDNLKDMYERGQRDTPQGEEHPNAYLSEEDVREIQRRYADGGVTQGDLASEYGVHQTTVSRIVKGSMWPHLSEDEL